MKTLSIAYIILFGWLTNLNAQNEGASPHSRVENIQVNDIGTPVELIISTQFELDGSGLYSEFSNRLILGGYITDKLKNQSLTTLKANNNRIGFQYQSCINLKISQGLGLGNAYWGVKLKDVIYQTQSFSEDFFKLVFMGNSPYKGQYLNIGPTESHTYLYNKLGFYVGWKLGEINKWTFESNINIYNGIRHNTNTFSDSRLYTPTHGEFLDLDFDMLIRESDFKRFEFKALGLGTDIRLKGFIANQYLIDFQVEDLGFIHWPNKNSLQLQDSIRFEGLYINNLMENVIINGKSEDINDSLLNSLDIKQDSSDLLKALPTRILLKGGVRIDEMTIEAGINYFFNLAHRPEFMLDVKYNLSPEFRMDVYLRALGYGTVNIGFGAKYSLWNKLDLSIQSRKLQGLLMPNSYNGQAIMLGLKVKL